MFEATFDLDLLRKQSSVHYNFALIHILILRYVYQTADLYLASFPGPFPPFSMLHAHATLKQLGGPGDKANL